MNKQGKNKIDWSDFTWNPVTGCNNGCSYCYANGIANRFGGAIGGKLVNTYSTLDNNGVICYDVPEPIMRRNNTKKKDEKAPYPFCFNPTFHRYRLDEPTKRKKGANIFVCSMGELFGDWVPDEWIETVFEACKKAPQHNYIFLTKNSYNMHAAIDSFGKEDNWWFGSTVTKQGDIDGQSIGNNFLSCEPLLGYISSSYAQGKKWLIFGLKTPISKDDPFEWDWIRDLVLEAIDEGIPVFMKRSMKGRVPEEYYLKQLPEGLRR